MRKYIHRSSRMRRLYVLLIKVLEASYIYRSNIIQVTTLTMGDTLNTETYAPWYPLLKRIMSRGFSLLVSVIMMVTGIVDGQWMHFLRLDEHFLSVHCVPEESNRQLDTHFCNPQFLYSLVYLDVGIHVILVNCLRSGSFPSISLDWHPRDVTPRFEIIWPSCRLDVCCCSSCTIFLAVWTVSKRSPKFRNQRSLTQNFTYTSFFHPTV